MSDITELEDKIENAWVEKYRPQVLDDLIVDEKVRKKIDKMRTDDTWTHILLCGIQGHGKTTLAKIIANEIVGGDVLYINASNESGIDTVRDKIIRFAQTASFVDELKIVIMDEFCGFGAQAQRALRNVMEEYSETCRFILTANRRGSIVSAILSRCNEIDIKPPIKDVVSRMLHILKSESIQIDKSQVPQIAKLVKFYYPDIRKTINVIQDNCSDGVFELEDIGIRIDIIDNIFDRAKNADLESLRRTIIENEDSFQKDYHMLLKKTLDFVFALDLPYEVKAPIISILGDHMYKHVHVMDPEVNAFCAFVKISQVFNE
tara:strand:+ start:3970 stop:4926 length:957 start_codon:yes stop_codon:yes gene_type:complete